MSRRCAEPTCPNLLAATSRASRFCSRDCKEMHHNREHTRGAQLLLVAMAWRQDGRSNHRKGTPVPPLDIPAWQLPAVLRGTGELPKSRWALVSRVIDSFIREDREMRELAHARQTA
jgi:hypothetical protein